MGFNSGFKGLICSSPLCFSNALGGFVGFSQQTAYFYICISYSWMTPWPAFTIFNLFIPAVFFECFRGFCRFQSIHSLFLYICNIKIYKKYKNRLCIDWNLRNPLKHRKNHPYPLIGRMGSQRSSYRLIWHSEDRTSWYILIIKTNNMHYFSTFLW